jgi:AcrR family transcriptional regulator
MAGSKSDVRRPGRPANPISRDAIIGMARSVFAAGGYAGASLSQIATKTGLRKASLYHHFASKELLYLAVVDTLLADISAIFSEALMSEGDFADRLDASAAAVIKYFGDNSDAAQILVREMVDGGPFVEAHGQDAIAQTVEIASQFFALGMDVGQFRKQDPKHLTLSLMGMLLYGHAAVGISTAFLGTSPFEGPGREERDLALRAHINQLVIG